MKMTLMFTIYTMTFLTTETLPHIATHLPAGAVILSDGTFAAFTLPSPHKWQRIRYGY